MRERGNFTNAIAFATGERLGLPMKLQIPYSIAFGSQTISVLREIHGFASLPRDRLAFIVCNQTLGKSIAHAGICVVEQTD